MAVEVAAGTVEVLGGAWVGVTGQDPCVPQWDPGIDAARLDVPYSQSDPVGPRTVPFIVGGLLLVCAVALAVNVLRGGRGEAEEGEDIDLSVPRSGGSCCRCSVPS